MAPLQGRKQSRLAFADEINVFRRTLLYAGLPNTSRWYDLAAPGETVGARSLIYLRRKDGIRAGELRRAVRKQLVPALVGTGALTELRTQTFLPWTKRLWDTPNVAHDKPHDQRFHASLILGYANTAARDAFYASSVIEELSNQLTPIASAIHAYDVTAALTYVKTATSSPTTRTERQEQSSAVESRREPMLGVPGHRVALEDDRCAHDRRATAPTDPAHACQHLTGAEKRPRYAAAGWRSG